jgi:hypothetical protein
MRTLTLTGKTGFTVKDVNVPVVIRDNRGLLFYSTEELVPRTKEFNLPAGKYIVDSGSFTAKPFPVNYKKISLPFAERLFRPSPGKFAIKFAGNPHKCTIDWDNKVITFDNSFKEKPLPVVDFIYSHEMGHKYFTQDKFADWFAYNRMLKMGYNPYQIGYAQLQSLQNPERKELLIKRIIKTYERKD